MKKWIVFLAFLAAAQAAFSQKMTADEVPKDIRTAFSEKFPDQKVDAWTLKNSSYEATFQPKKGGKMAALFTPDGYWAETQTALKRAELPAAVRAKLIGKPLKKASKIECPDGSVTYEVWVRSKKWTFNKKGKRLG